MLGRSRFDSHQPSGRGELLGMATGSDRGEPLPHSLSRALAQILVAEGGSRH
jgi:hypothetical protein